MNAPQSQALAAHVPTPQSIPQPPQFAGSLAYVAGSTHAPAHTSSPAGHRQVPATHVAPVAQAFPHPPQFASSSAYVAGSTQRPRQRSWPCGQSAVSSVHEAQLAATARAEARRRLRRVRVTPR
jgi:capsular polysaccharide biosynthesis protein